MVIKYYPDLEPTRFDSDVVKGVAARVLLGKADGAPNFCMRVFEIGVGGNSPRHTHAWEHEMFFHAGQGELYGDGVWNPVTAGSTALVPGNAEHQIRNTGDTPLVFVCMVPAGAPEL